MKRILFPIVVCAMIAHNGLSQNEVDALRYSQTFIGGTARYVSMGGAFGSLGAEFSTASTNPAGFGLYKRSEFTITPAVYTGRTESDFNGSITYDSRTNFNLGNAGVVLVSPAKMDSRSVLKSFQYGFGVNRVNNFNNRMLIQGYNNTNSIIDTYVDRSNGIYFGDIEDDRYGDFAYDLRPAWYTYMTDTIPGFFDQYQGAIPTGTGVVQRKEMNTWGSMNELVFALSANFSERLYLGVSMNFPFIRYFKESYYSEIDMDDQVNGFNDLGIYEDLITRGTGFNIKFGAIGRITDYLRIGGAIHSPSWFFNMRDEWYSEFSTRFDDNSTYFERSPFGSYDYKLETPWKAMGSFSLVLARAFILSGEYEYMDYSKSKLRSGGYNYYDENYAIQEKYSVSHTIRVGSEVRLGSFAIRAGGGFYSSPYADDINDGARSFISGGLGYRERDFFIDLAYLQSWSNEDYYLYGSENVSFDPVQNKYSSYNVSLTLGFRI